MLATLTLTMTLLCSSSAQAPDAGDNAVYLADHEELLTYAQQGWGELGLNTCAHAPGQNPLSLQIGDKTYAKGLGHHASGEIIIDLNGQYDAFLAEVGVQQVPNSPGTVVFKVFVDDEARRNWRRGPGLCPSRSGGLGGRRVLRGAFCVVRLS